MAGDPPEAREFRRTGAEQPRRRAHRNLNVIGEALSPLWPRRRANLLSRVDDDLHAGLQPRFRGNT
jgi:hypothetical protein